MVQMTVLLASVAGGSYAGTSALFAAFLAGAGYSWRNSMAACGEAGGGQGLERIGLRTYGAYYKPVVKRVLKAFFLVCLRCLRTVSGILFTADRLKNRHQSDSPFL
jgi:hypothetical protein